MAEYSVSVEQMVKKFGLINLTPEVNYSHRKITQCDVNRPALQLAGFFDYFDPTRLQTIGKVEHAYLETIADEQERNQKVKKLMDYTDIPCIVMCREGIYPSAYMLECARNSNVPIFKTDMETSTFIAEANRWLHVELAPRTSLHGVLVDIYGEGVLITGESGIGKSETALELIRRGHRLVADDAVEVKKVSAVTLLGSAPPVLRHFIEVRGIGIVDIKQIYGVGAIKEQKNIDLIIKLEFWDGTKQYDRLGLNDEVTDIMGIKVVTNSIPIRPGRNSAIICETAAINFRQKKMGYNAAEVLNKRVSENINNPNF